MLQTSTPGTRKPTVSSPRGSWLSTGIGLGMAVGVALGNIVVDIAIGVAAGTLLGIGLGIVLERSDRQRRDRDNRRAESGIEPVAADPHHAQTASAGRTPARGLTAATDFTVAS
ncbi:hypothetical protein EXU48_16610 [Occultella glacieicola]|uniref:Glycine zipper domain-containing protein n=1 Tax=Occultella glacieicola TaxID=2518684 RepID=A0ABY2E176_9MICO|nr:hypothetical protein [Occultella glacieicola]TDE90745.1 hypothetical protein EXU48_16610 [Occultella glacieicola]